jgi:hypothetical protein
MIMLDVCYLKKVALNVKSIVIKVAKYKQRGSLTYIQNTKSL